MNHKITAKFIRANGKSFAVEPDNGKYFESAELQALLGGFVAFVYPPSKAGAVMVVNEWAPDRGLPVNVIATDLLLNGANPMLFLGNGIKPVQGDVLLCHRSQLEPEQPQIPNRNEITRPIELPDSPGSR